MKKAILLTAIFILLGLTSSAITLHPDTLAARMWRQVMAFPQEKLYAQTDRAEYTCGDTIWVRHHIANATTLVPTHESRHVYVELIDPFGKLVCRKMMRQDTEGNVYGYIPTDLYQPAGLYTLRAYTRYMAMTTPDYLFERPVRLSSSIDNSVRITASSHAGTVKQMFSDPISGKQIHNGNVRISSAKGEMSFTGNTDKGISLHAVDMDGNRRCLLVEIGNYKEYVPINQKDIDLQLMPEGGHLIMGQQCRVAYKTVAKDRI